MNNEYNGWLNIYKEKGITSHDVVYKVRRKLNFKKIGHAGTLDPMAEGVMVIALGKTTRLIQYLTETKKYKAGILLGIETDSYDADGKVTAIKEVNISKEEIKNELKKFSGKISQIPPMVSALKQNGKKLYELARQGIEVERKPREIEVFYINILKIEIPYIEIEVSCQSGTYIRSIAHDLGKNLNCGAHLTLLERIEANQFFTIDSCLKVDEITENSIFKPDYPLQELPAINLVEEIISKKYMNGQIIQSGYNDCENVRVYDEKNIFLGIGNITNGLLKAKTNLHQAGS